MCCTTPKYRMHGGARMRELTLYRSSDNIGQTGSSVLTARHTQRTHISYAHLYFDSENENGKDNVTTWLGRCAVHSP